MAHKSIITADVYVKTLKSLRDAIKEKRRGLLSCSVMLLHDNAVVHKAMKVQAAIAKCGFQEMNHPPYSLDLVPCDYFLFRHLKKHLHGRQFSSDTDIQADRGWRVRILASILQECHCFRPNGTSALNSTKAILKINATLHCQTVTHYI